MEKMTISFWIWGMLDDGGIYHDLDTRMNELKERGFNTIRTESLAGLLSKPDSSQRGKVHIRRPFGKYGRRVRQMDILRHDIYVNAAENIVRFFSAAKRNGVKVIISSWYFLHTNWFLDEDLNDEIYSLPTEEKFRYFKDEYSKILTLLEENNLTEPLAFYELFNEFTGIYFTHEKDIDIIRKYHEKSIAELKKLHPWAKAAYDIGATPDELIPRNVDFLNYHLYHLWFAYRPFEQDMVIAAEGDPEYNDITKSFTYEKIISVNDVEKARGGRIRSAIDWERRVALYDSIDPKKIPLLEQSLEENLQNVHADCFDAFEKEVYGIVKQRDRTVPKAKLIMGEGMTYCCANDLLFEEHSNLYWSITKKQAKLLRSAGFVGSVVRTTSGPEDPSWNRRKDEYIEANKIFSGEA